MCVEPETPCWRHSEQEYLVEAAFVGPVGWQRRRAVVRLPSLELQQ